MGARVAVLSDVHANPWALRAVLAEVRAAGVDLVVDCGDLVAGPWPSAVVEELYGCGLPVLSVRGNGDRMVADAFDQRPGWEDDVPAPARRMIAWAAAHLREQDRRLVGTLPLTAEVDVDGLGPVTFFHATALSDEEIVLPAASEDRVLQVLSAVETAVAVGGHTHLPDDRTAAGHRLVNAGSVGKPFDAPEAAWLLLGPDVQLRRTGYDTATAHRAAAALTGADGAAVAEEFIDSLHPPGRAAVLDVFAPAAAAQAGHLTARSRLRTLDG